MSLRPENLPRDPDVLIGMVIERDVEIERLKTALKTLNSLIHGPRSERASVVLEGQTILDLGDLETDVTLVAANDDASTPPTAPGVKPRKKARRNIGFLPKHLPRVEEVIEPESTDCPCCAGKLHRIGEETGEALDGVPATLRVLRTIRPKYACRSCQGGVVQAPARARLFDGGMATTALIANVVVWKFAWHVPLYRQVQILAGQGVNLDRATLALWVKRVAWWLTPLYELQLRQIHSYPRIFCDESVLQSTRRREECLDLSLAA